MIPTDINSYSVIEQYERYYKHYQKKYGKVAIMYQHGAHYNFFSTEKFGNVRDISSDITLTLTYRDKLKGNKNTCKNPMMAGFPIGAKSDYIKKLLINEYVVVEIREQKAKKKKDDKLIPREVVAIYTPGTHIDDFCDENYIVQIFIEEYKDKYYQPMTVGLSAIDINTGEINYYEVYNTPDDENYAIDEIYRYIQAHTPKEILIYSRNNTFTLDRYTYKKQNIPKEIEKENARYAFLERCFPQRSVKNIIVYLDLEMMQTAAMSLSLLLYYVYEHNSTMLDNLKKPSLWFSERYMLLANNAIEQLDIVNKQTNKNNSIFNLIDMTSTAMGKRLLKYKLTHPLRNTEAIEMLYDNVEMFHDWKIYEDVLTGMVDLTRYHRKVENQTIVPLQLAFLIDTYKDILKLLTVLPRKFKVKFNRIRPFIEEIVQAFDLEECRQYNNMDDIATNIFRKGYSEKLDRLSEIIEISHDKIEAIRKTFIPDLPKRARLKIERDNEYYIRVTPKQFEMLSKKHDVDRIHTRVKSYVPMTTPKMRKISASLMDAEEHIQEKIKEYYLDYLKYIEKEFRKSYVYIDKLVAEIDVYKSSAKCAEKYNYSRPISCDKDHGYMSCEDLRHPLIERMDNGTIYVPHTLKMGNQQGMVIYGHNASGKTALMKALGTNLVMAQAGFFVAAKKFRYTPYENIQTRILGNDNIFKGLSSFAVEMLELRGILARAGPKSFILGDEICHGTETISGLAIVCAAVIELINSNANFVFASHLHELVNMKEIKNYYRNRMLGIYHLEVERRGNKLIYKRTLKEGPGDSLYGIEVARAMNLQEFFVKRANKIRKRIIHEEILGRQSRWNAKMFLRTCAICGEKAVHTHHIRYQEEANEKGFIDHFHKNELGNLVGLCEKHHHQQHRGDINIKGYDDTSNGLSLNYSINDTRVTNIAYGGVACTTANSVVTINNN